MNLQIIFIIFGLLEKQKTLAQKIDETAFLFAVLSSSLIRKSLFSNLLPKSWNYNTNRNKI